HAGAGTDLRLARGGVRRGDGRGARDSARAARRRNRDRGIGGADHGVHRAGVGAARVLLAPHRRAARAAGEDLAMRARALAGFAAAGIGLSGVPFFGPPAFYESFLYLVFHWIVLAVSWNILSGYSGYFSFGHGAFFGAGMYTTATLTTQAGVPFLWTLPAAALVAAVFGIALGAVVFRLPRLRGELFALLTLAVTFVLATVVLNTPIDGGPGLYLSAVPLPAIGPSPSSTFYLLGLALALTTLWIAREIQRSRFGTGLFAIHDDEDVAEVMGVPTYRFKLAAFALSCALAGLAGGIHAVFVSYVTVAETFSGFTALYVILMAALGGTRHWLGPAVGAAAVTALMYLFTTGDFAVAGRALIGLIFIVVILLMPEGILRRKRNSGSEPESGSHVENPIRALTPNSEPILIVHSVTKA